MPTQGTSLMTVDEAALGLSRAWRTNGMKIDGDQFLAAVASVDEAVCRAHGAEPALGVQLPESREERVARIARATIARHARSPLTSTPAFWEGIVASVLDEAERPHPRAR